MGRNRNDTRRQPTAVPPGPIGPFLRSLAVAALVACALAAVFLACTDIFDTDFGRHVAYGRLLLKDFGAVRSITMGQAPEITQQAYSYWLYEGLLALTFDRLGPVGIVGLRAIVLLASFLLAVLLARRLGAPVWGCAVGAALALLVSHERFLDRPEIFSFLAWSGALWILIRHRKTRLVWLLVPLQVLWVNTHLWFGLLPVLAMAFLAGDLIERRARPRRDGALLASLLVASFIGPAGAGAWASQLYIVRFLGQGYSLPFQIGEMMSPFSGYGTNFGIWSFRIALPLVLLLVLAAHRRLGWGAIFALLAAAILASRARRAIPLFGITAAVLLPLALADFARRLRGGMRDAVAVALTASALAACLTGSWTLLTGRFFLARNEDRRVAFAFSRSYPGLEASRFVRREGIEGPIFNPPLTAGAVVLENGNRLPPFLDARWVGTPETISAYAGLRQANDATVGEIWKKLDGSRRFEAVLLDFDKLPALLRHLSLNEPGWVTVHVDDQAAVLCRRGGKNERVIERNGDRLALVRSESDPDREAALGQEVVRFLASRRPSILTPLSFPFGAYGRSQYAYLLDRRPEAQEAYLGLLRAQNGSLWESPSLSKVLSDLFWCLQKSDQPRAIIALAEAIERREKLNPDQIRFLNARKARAMEQLRGGR